MKKVLLIICIAMGVVMKTQTTESQATFAGGCFWCMQPAFEKQKGVTNVVSGYMGGTGANPTYSDYAQKGYVEVIHITYNPQEVTYPQLLNILWRNIDPTDAGGQFVDRGAHYRSAIFYHTDEQKQQAEESKNKLQASGKFNKLIVTEVVPATAFYPAEKYHQKYAEKNPWKYWWYRFNSGRDAFLQKIWGKDKAKAELRTKLSPLQYKVTQKNGTEPAFSSPYWNTINDGIYVDVVSGEPLFSSKDQFVSSSGWPSFTKPITHSAVEEKEDKGWFSTRTEIRSKHADSHLGHVFNDGPEPTGKRYCMNGAALRFVPKQDLEKEGYGEYAALFK